MKESFFINHKLPNGFIVIGSLELNGTDYTDIERNAKGLLKGGINGELDKFAIWNRIGKKGVIDENHLFLESIRLDKRIRVKITRHRITKVKL